MSDYMIVTARMREPVIYYEDGMHLDGPLSYAAFRAYQRAGGAPLPPITDPWAVDFDLPLERWAIPLPDGADVDQRLLDSQGLVWGWMCSRVEADWLGRGKMEYRKRPDTQRMGRYTTAKSHQLGTGPLKAFDVAFPTLTARELRWVAVGDVDEVRRLLHLVTHIGKKSTTGMGAVDEWTVETCEQRSFERRMPCDGGMLGAIRAPYHHVSRRVPAGWETI